MNTLLNHVRSAVTATLVLAAVCGGVYPLIVWAVAQSAFRGKANGSLIVDRDGAVRGSRLIGQPFTAARYFHPRPSAAGNGYDAANSSGSNLGPTSRKLRDAIRDRISAYRMENGLRENDSVPVDAVTASGSGLDPHISVQNAEIQSVRVARARGVEPARVAVLIRSCTEGPDLGVFGEEGVNVLRLNLALDGEKH